MAGLKPEVSIPVAAGCATLVYAVYSQATPSIADVRVAKPDDPEIDSSRRTAAWMAAGIVAGISLLSKDPTVFVVGGAMVIGMDWWTRHSNVYSPSTGKINGAPVGITPPAPNESDVQVTYAESY